MFQIHRRNHQFHDQNHLKKKMKMTEELSVSALLKR